MEHRQPPIKPRRRVRIEHPNHARFLTFSCYHNLPLFLNDSIKDDFASHLLRVRDDLSFTLTAWVVMPNHVHLLLVPDIAIAPASEILSRLKRPFAQRVLARWKRLEAPILARVTDEKGARRFWQRGGGYDRNVFSDDEILEKTTYIENNPVRAGLAHRATDYRWSSAPSRGAR